MTQCQRSSSFPAYATQGALAVAGDFNHDGYGDIALAGGVVPSTDAPWGSIPVAFSNGDGSFRVTTPRWRGSRVAGFVTEPWAPPGALTAAAGRV
jgi:hypothetical protein